MKFIVDAQLPRSLSVLLNRLGHDTIHTIDLPLKNATPDTVVNNISKTESRIVISKDADFLQSHLVQGIPRKLIMVKTGNFHNSLLLSLFENNIELITQLLEEQELIEVTATEIIAHT